MRCKIFSTPAMWQDMWPLWGLTRWPLLFSHETVSRPTGLSSPVRRPLLQERINVFTLAAHTLFRSPGVSRGRTSQKRPVKQKTPHHNGFAWSSDVPLMRSSYPHKHKWKNVIALQASSGRIKPAFVSKSYSKEGDERSVKRWANEKDGSDNSMSRLDH